MSVLACDRAGCGNIMCQDMVLDGSAYICYECLEELKESRRRWRHDDEFTEEFMNTDPGHIVYGNGEVGVNIDVD